MTVPSTLDVSIGAQVVYAGETFTIKAPLSMTSFLLLNGTLGEQVVAHLDDLSPSLLLMGRRTFMQVTWSVSLHVTGKKPNGVRSSFVPLPHSMRCQLTSPSRPPSSLASRSGPSLPSFSATVRRAVCSRLWSGDGLP